MRPSLASQHWPGSLVYSLSLFPLPHALYCSSSLSIIFICCCITCRWNPSTDDSTCIACPASPLFQCSSQATRAEMAHLSSSVCHLSTTNRRPCGLYAVPSKTQQHVKTRGQCVQGLHETSLVPPHGTRSCYCVHTADSDKHLSTNRSNLGVETVTVVRLH